MKNLKLILISILFCLTSYAYSYDIIPSPTARSELNPNISIIGNFVGKLSDKNADKDKNKFFVREAEVSLQGFLYPQVRGDAFFAMHRHDEQLQAELCEGYVTFQALSNSLSAKLGKIHVDFGKVNKIHGHELPFTEKPLVLTEFLGHHGLVGEGIVFDNLFNTSSDKYLSLKIGTWYISSHHHHEEGEEAEPFSLAHKVHTAKLSFSNSLTENSEVSIGLSALKGYGAHFSHHKDKVKLYAFDFTYRKWFPQTYKKLLIQTEWFFLNRDLPVEKLKRNGGYLFINKYLNKYWDIGIRLDTTQSPWPVGNSLYVSRTNSYRFTITKHLTETFRIRLELEHTVPHGRESYNAAYFQIIWGIGPHAHPIS